MVIICTICKDAVNPSENLHAISCGHIFHHECLARWIQRSKTCPQCRNVVTEKRMFRVFPTISNNDSTEDAAALQSKLEDAQLELRELTVACREKDQKIALLNHSIESLRDDLKSVKEQHSSNMRDLLVLRSESKAKSNYLAKLQEEVESWKQKAVVLVGLQSIINDSDEEVARMLAAHTDIKTVVTLAAALKRLLTESEAKKNECRDRLNEVTQELQQEKINTEKLRVNFEQIQEKLYTTEKLIKRLSNKRKAPESSEKLNLDEDATSSVNDENTSFHTLVNRIVNADSPYLNLKTTKSTFPAAHKSKTVTGVSSKSKWATLDNAENFAPKKARTDTLHSKCSTIDFRFFPESQHSENSAKDQQAKESQHAENSAKEQQSEASGYMKLYTRPVAYEIGTSSKPLASVPKLTTKHRITKPKPHDKINK